MPSPCSPPMTGEPGTGWHVEHGTPPDFSGDVQRVSAAADICGEEARIARRVGHVSRAVARRARQCASGLVVATRAGGRGRVAPSHPGGARRCTVVAAAARVRVAGIEHLRPVRRPEDRAVKARRARVDDARVVDIRLKSGRAAREPGRDAGLLGIAEQTDVRSRREGGEDGRLVAGRQRGRHVRGHASDCAEEGRRAPPGRGGRVAVAFDAVRLKDGRDVDVVDGRHRRARARLRARRHHRRARAGAE